MTVTKQSEDVRVDMCIYDACKETSSDITVVGEKVAYSRKTTQSYIFFLPRGATYSYKHLDACHLHVDKVHPSCQASSSVWVVVYHH